MDTRDGFSVRAEVSGGEIDFVPCIFAGHNRELVLRGLLRRVADDHYVVDTRDDD